MKKILILTLSLIVVGCSRTDQQETFNAVETGVSMSGDQTTGQTTSPISAKETLLTQSLPEFHPFYQPYSEEAVTMAVKRGRHVALFLYDAENAHSRNADFSFRTRSREFDRNSVVFRVNLPITEQNKRFSPSTKADTVIFLSSGGLVQTTQSGANFDVIMKAFSNSL